MKKKLLTEIKQLDLKGLQKRVQETKEELISLVLDKNMGKLKDLKSISKKRKNIAQMLTVFRQKQLLGELGIKKGVKSLK